MTAKPGVRAVQRESTDCFTSLWTDGRAGSADGNRTHGRPGMVCAMNRFILLLALAVLAACGAPPTPMSTPTADIQATIDAPAAEASAPAAPTLTPTVRKENPGIPTPTPSSAPTEESPAPSVQRKVGEYDEVRFSVGEGSKVTFKVTEQLLKFSFPNDAVLETEKLEGVVVLDGGVSRISVDLHSLESDSNARDRYVRLRMFPDNRFAEFIVDLAMPLPKEFSIGQEVTRQVPGTLTIKAANIPLVFDITAQDLVDQINISGRTIVTWEQLKMPKPTARSVLSVEDNIKVQFELVIRPL